jgi:hypothetical protein
MFIKILFLVFVFTVGDFFIIINSNIEVGLLLLTNLIMHSYSLARGFALMRFYHFPFVICVAVINILSGYVSIINVPFDDFQCGYFNYKSLYYQIVFFAVFYFFYFFVSHRFRFSSNNIKPGADISTTNNIVLAILAFAASFISFPITDFRNTMAYLAYGLLLLSYFRKESNFFVALFLIVTAGIILLNAVLSTLVWMIIYFLFFSAVIFFVERKHISKAKKILFSSIAFIVLIFSYLYSAVKMDVRTNDELFSGSSSKQFGRIFDQVKKSKEDQTTDHSSSIFWRLTYTSSALSHVIQETPERVPFWNGVSYYPLFFKFIPRILWPDKPTENMGQDFGHAYGLLNDGNLTTSMNAPIIAEAYFNFGIFGILVVPIFLAFFEALTFIQINRRNGSLTRFNVYFIATFGLYSIQWESNLSMFIGKFIIIYFFYKLVSLFTGKKQKI